MKSCPKCNRTFPDEGQKFCTFDGGLLIAPQTFDPNMTIRATAVDVVPPSEKTTSRDLPDPNATLAESSFASTVALPRTTGPTGPRPPRDSGQMGGDYRSDQQTSVNPNEQTIALSAPRQTGQPPPVTPPPPVQTSAPLVSATLPSSSLPAAAAPAEKKSKLPWIIVGIVLFLLLGGGGLAAAFFLVGKPWLEQMRARQHPNDNKPVVEANANSNANTNTSANANSTPIAEVTPADNYVAPLGTTLFENSSERLDGKLSEHYFDFRFYYPESWQKDAKAGVPGANSFVRVERRLPPDFTQENFTVGWFTSTGTYESDLPNYPRRVEELSNALAKSIPEYRKVSEGPTKVNSMKAYEFRYVGFSKNTEQGDLKIWGRVVFLPTGKEGDTTGATLSMLSTSLAPELTSVDDLGVKGEAPVILDSFRFGKKK